LKEFIPISREEAIKKVVDYFYTHGLENIGIVFEKQRDATAFLDEVKKILNKEDSEVWNKKSICNKNKVRILTDNGRSRSRILSGYTCEKLFVEKKCFEKHFDDITYAGCVMAQCGLNPDNVENYLIDDGDNN
jgi:hypothetical protein